MSTSLFFLRSLGCALALLAFFAATLTSAQTLSSVSPNYGPRFGGTTVVLTGTNLENVNEVTFNGIVAEIQGQASAESITVITGTADVSSYGIGEIELDSVPSGEMFTYIDPVDVFDVKDTVGKEVRLGDFVEADLSGAETITIFITDVSAGITITQFNDDPISGPFPVAVSDTVGARIKVTFPSTAGRTDAAIVYRVETEAGEQESNHINLLTLEESCSVTSLVPPLGVEYVSPPAPTLFGMTYAQDTKTFEVYTSMAYLRDNAVISIDFAGDYVPNTHGVRTTTTLCNSRTTVSAETAPFYDLFYSAPTATFANALDGSLYHAYPPTGAFWTVENANDTCNAVAYRGSFTFAELVACDQHDGSPAVTVTSGAGSITYSGDVWVNVMQPLDPESESTTYHTSRFRYPFSFQFNSAVQAINTVTSTQDLVIDVVSASVATTEPRVLTIVVKTTSSVDGVDSTLASVGVTGLFPESTAISTVSAPVCESGTATCVQQWTYTSDDPWELTFNGEYRFEWSYNEGATQVSAVLNLQHVLTPSTSETNLELATVSLSFFDNESDLLANTNSHLGAFGNADRVHVRATLNMDGGAANNFGLGIDDLYICWENNAVFDVSLPEGCEASFIPSNQVVHLIAASSVSTVDPATRFTPAVLDVPNNAAGASFAAQPLATRLLSGQLFHVHMKLTIVQSDSNERRSFVVVGRADATKTSLSSFEVYFEEESADEASTLVPFWVNFILN